MDNEELVTDLRFLTKNENGERSVNVGTRLLRLLINCAILRIVRKKTT